MKLKCDLIVQNLNKQISTSQEKLYKSAMIGLYRPKLCDNALSYGDESNDKTIIILTVEASDLSLKFKLKRIETYTKFIREGKATLKLIDENIFLLISNTPSLTLTNFISFLNMKLCKSNQLLSQKTRSATDLEPNSTQKYVNKLLNKVQCSLGTNALSHISPLTEKEVSEVMRARQEFKHATESPIRAADSSQSRLFRSQSSNCVLAPSANASTTTSSTKLCKSLSGTDLNMLVQLTDEQRHVLKLVKSGKSIFFTGSGGSGKSFLINIVRKSLPSDSCFVTASTGVAASLINGITIHAFAGFTLSSDESAAAATSSASSCTQESRMRNALNRVLNSREKMINWKKCHSLIVDEISMIDAEYFDCLDYVARSVKNQPDLPFGGIQIILSGDFLQLPPVSKYNEEKKRFCFQARAWSKCIDECIQLTKIKRQTDSEFISILEEIRFGVCSQRTIDLFEKNKSIQFKNKDILPTKLCTHKDDVDIINKRELECLANETHLFKSIDTDNLGNENTAYLRKMLDILCPAIGELALKKNAQVMLIKNLDVSKSLVNGARGVVVGFEQDKKKNPLPIVRFLNGAELTLKYDSWSYKLNTSGGIVTRKQLPLQLAWAISIHKSQGMTLDCVEISLSRVFEYGQAYVALSRAKSLHNLKILDFDPNAIKANEIVLKFYERLHKKNASSTRLDFDKI